jgi:hypothetical protein
VLEPLGLGDVNLLLPAAAVVAGVALGLTGRPYIGAGVGAGAILAFFNSGLLLKRIELAASAPNPAAALMAMQLGLLVTFTLVGIITVIMIRISVEMTVAMAITFLVAQTGQLLLIYRVRRSRPEASQSGGTLSGESL